jgi:hypothetical protein
VNVNLEIRFPAVSRMVAQVGNSMAGHLVPFSVRSWLGTVLRRSNRRPQARPALDPDLRRALMRRYRPEVEHLSDALGRDLLSLWGYNQ